jgi:hypothetical protein
MPRDNRAKVISQLRLSRREVRICCALLEKGTLNPEQLAEVARIMRFAEYLMGKAESELQKPQKAGRA